MPGMGERIPTFPSITKRGIPIPMRDSSYLEQLENPDDDVVDVAKPRGLELLGVVESAAPVDGDVALPVVELGGALHGGAGVARAKVVEAVEHGAVVANVEVGKAFGEALER